MEARSATMQARIAEIVEKLKPLRPVLAQDDGSKYIREMEHLVGVVLTFGDSRKSPLSEVLSDVGNHWRSAILLILRICPLRPSAIQKSISIVAPNRPISQRMMTLNLRLLERDGLIERKEYFTGRSHVEYELTEMGRELSNYLFSIVRWVEDNIENIMLSRKNFECSYED